jgi:hypothetical protein
MNLITVATDNFNRANANNPGANWTVGPEGNRNAIFSNQIANQVATTPASDYWSANTFSVNQWSQATCVQINPGNTDYSSVLVHCSATSWVAFGPQNGGNTNVLYIYWYNSGSFTELVDDAGANGGANGKTLLLVAVGTTYYAYLNGALILTTTSASPPTTGNPGIHTYGANVDGSLWDNWSGGDVISNLSMTGAGS